MSARIVKGAKGSYQLQGSALSGGQAEVYAARGPDGKQVAVKLYRGAGVDRERAALIGCAAPEGPRFVVPLLDWGVAPDGRDFLVLEWFDQSLHQWISRGDVPLTRRLLAAELACRAVHRLHHHASDIDRVFVHRDIKPGNLLIAIRGGDMEVLLADMGLAREGRLTEKIGHSGQITPGYGPPEQAIPLRVAADPSIDAHALAATVYRMICGRLPQSVQARAACYKPEALRLFELVALGNGIDAAGRKELEALQARPLRDFFDLEGASALLPEDERRLTLAIEEALAGAVAEPGPLAEALTTLLLPELRRCLEPDPDIRQSEVRRLYAACQRAREQVQGALPPEALASPLPDPPPPAPPRIPWLALSGVALLAMGGVLGVGILGASWLMPDVEPMAGQGLQTLGPPDSTTDEPTTAPSPPTQPPAEAVQADPTEKAPPPAIPTHPPTRDNGRDAETPGVKSPADEPVDEPPPPVTVPPPAPTFTLTLKAAGSKSFSGGVDDQPCTSECPASKKGSTFKIIPDGNATCSGTVYFTPTNGTWVASIQGSKPPVVPLGPTGGSLTLKCLPGGEVTMSEP